MPIRTSFELPDTSPRNRLFATIGAFQLAAVWLVAFVACAALRRVHVQVSAALWGLLLLGSFVAWGRFFQQVTGDDRRLGWAFDGSVGMALTLAGFGVLACARLVSVPLILVWAAAGPLLEAWARLRAAPASNPPALAPALLRRFVADLRVRRPQLVFAACIAVLWLMAALQYCYAVSDANFNQWDDNMAYRSFVRQFLDTGTIYEPFSYRRVAAYGGASLLQALVLAFSDRDRIHISDDGIAVLLTLGLITTYRAGPRRAVRAAILAAGLLLLSLPYERHNLGGQMTGCALFLALFRLFDDASFDARPARANAVLAGLLAAAICTQRQNYVAVALGFLALFFLLRVAYPGRTAWRAWLRQGVMAGGAAVAFLIPWCALAFVNARTAFYPLMNGNVNRAFGVVDKVSFVDELKWTLRLLLASRPITSVALLFLAAAMLPFARRARALHAFLLATALAFVLMMHYFRTFADAESILRYLFAFTVAFCLASVLRTFREGARPARAHIALAATAMAAVAVGSQIMFAKDKMLELYSLRLDATAVLFSKHGATAAKDPLEGVYRRLQASVPPGEPILMTLDHTFMLDGRRNRLYNYDHPGVIGPRGGPPAFQGPEAFASYLRSLGIRYMAYVFGPSSPEYKRDQWEGRRINGLQGFWLQAQARFELDFFDTITALAASRRSVFHEGDIRVLDLATAATPPAAAPPAPAPATP